jgi:hypothetical protein
MSVVLKDKSDILGTKDNLPHDLAKIVVRSEVIAWTAFDPELERDVRRFACRALFYLPLIFPCALIVLPILLVEKMNLQRRIRNQYWILTETHLKIVTKSYERCCIPGCNPSADSVQSIPLEDIICCEAETVGNVCWNSNPLPTIFVDTPANGVNADPEYGSPLHAAVGYGLSHQVQFIREVLNRRDIFKGNLLRSQAAAAAAAALVATPVAAAMERGGNEKSTA